MGVVDFAVKMRSRAAEAQFQRRRLPQIRIAPAIAEIGRWEWAVLEESRAETPGELRRAQAERVALANGIEDNPMLACYAAVCAFEEIMTRPPTPQGEPDGKR